MVGLPQDGYFHRKLKIGLVTNRQSENLIVIKSNTLVNSYKKLRVHSKFEWNLCGVDC